MDFMSLIVVAVIVLGWGFFKRTLRVGEEMAVRGLEKLNDEQKVISVKFYEKLDVNTEAVASAKANKSMLDSLNI